MVISDEGEQVDIRWRLMRYRAAKSGCGCARVNCGGVPSGIEWFGAKGGGSKHVRDRYRWPSFLVSLFHMSRLLISP